MTHTWAGKFIRKEKEGHKFLLANNIKPIYANMVLASDPMSKHVRGMPGEVIVTENRRVVPHFISSSTLEYRLVVPG